MVVVVTRNVPDRFRGFLASCMLEIGPGVYTGPRMSKGVRERVWKVLEEWWTEMVPGEAGIVMTWRQDDAPGGQGLGLLGIPKREFVEHEGMVLIRWEVPPPKDFPERLPEDPSKSAGEIEIRTASCPKEG